jgi:hypothetical protein
MFTRDCNQLRIGHVVEDKLAQPGPPDAVENISVSAQSRSRQVVTPNTRFAVDEVFIEDVVAQPNLVEAF